MDMLAYMLGKQAGGGGGGVGSYYGLNTSLFFYSEQEMTNRISAAAAGDTIWFKPTANGTAYLYNAWTDSPVSTIGGVTSGVPVAITMPEFPISVVIGR